MKTKTKKGKRKVEVLDSLKRLEQGENSVVG